MDSILVLMSTYNGQSYISQQIDSILNQQCDCDIFILIRDDSSKDRTVEIIKDYAEKFNNISIIQGDNVGPAKSFFELINNAPSTYDYYAFSDQDDVWESNKLQRAVTQLSLHRVKPAIYYTGQKLVDEQLVPISNHILDTQRSRFANFILNQTAGCTVVFNRQLLEKLKLSNNETKSGHDIWAYRVCAAIGGSICVEAEGSILYRQHSNNSEGLDNSVFGKIKRIPVYLDEYISSRDAGIIIEKYRGDISSKNEHILRLIATSNNNIKSRFKLLASKDIKFHNPVLRIVFIIKVLMKKL